MKIVANPVLLRALMVLACATFAFLVGLLFIRSLRKSITEEPGSGNGCCTLARTVAAAPLQHGDPATETAEA